MTPKLWCDLIVTSSESNYVPSPTPWVRDHVEQIEAAGDTRGVLHPMGLPLVLITMRGAKSGNLRKVPLMRVEHEGRYLAVASKGGAPDNPQWFHNLIANPDITVMDGQESRPYRARLLDDGPERAQWWQRAVAAFAPYEEYQAKTDRQIPTFVLEPTEADPGQP